MATGMKHISRGFGVQNAKRDIPSPYLTANLISRGTLWWMNNHIWRGFKRPLSPTDIYTVIPEETSARHGTRLEREWKCIPCADQRKEHSLLKTVLWNDWKLFAVSILLILLGEISKFVQPFLIAELVSHFKGKGYVSVEQAWGYAVGMVLLTIFYSIFSTYGQFLGQVVAMRWRTSCTALMSRKASRLSSKALSEISSGTVINLLATDVEKFYNAASEFRGLFVGPLVLLVLLLIMAVTVQLSILPALVFVALLTAFRMQTGNISGRIRTKLADWSDKRIHLVTEIVSSMMMIKAFCWEKVFGAKAQELRHKEVKSVGWVIFFNSLNLILGYTCDKVVTFFLIITFILSGHAVDYKLALQVLTWMKMGQLGFLNFPVGYSMWKQMEASLSRIQKCLLEEEIINGETVGENTKFMVAEEFTGYERIRKESAISSAHQVKITLKNVSASWAISEKHHTEAQKMMKHSLLRSISSLNQIATGDKFTASGTFSLRNISLSVHNGMLVGLVGPVGSGKTSLLLVILGNLKLGDGVRRLKGKIAYVPQQPWIRADTVRNNILMGEKMDRSRYSEVLKACALQKDISAMNNGDATPIGDKGSSLSGGQRARISLARAVYRNADIYILDDPFSSLDFKVGTHIFHECVQGLLKGKLVLMATHYVHLLKYADHVVVLKDGRMLASGTLDNVKQCVNLSELIKDPEHNMLDQTEVHDVFEKQDKKNMLMPLLTNDHIVKEHAHIPEKRATSIHVYLKYWRAGYGPVLMTFFCLLLMGQQALSIVGEYWLVYRISDGSANKKYKDYAHDYDKNSSYGNNSHGHNYFNTSNYGDNHNSSFTVHDAYTKHEANFAAAKSAINVEDQVDMLGTYAIYIMLGVLLGLLASLSGTLFMVMAARNLYNAMFTRILWAPMTTFSSDKTGEMVNRFARDTGRMDDIIPITISATFMTAAIIISQAAYICVINYYVVIATLPFLICLTLFVAYCIRAIRDTKRLESEFRTPTFEHLQHLLHGLEVIRAFGMEMLMIEEADKFLDRHTAAWHMYIGSMYWMKMRLNWFVALYLAVVLVIALASPHKEAMATPLGLSLAYIVVFMGRIQYVATYATMLDTNMTSVEHVAEYDHLEQEPPCHTDYPLPPGWPMKAHIQVRNIELIYPGSKTHALKNITFDVHPGQKVGIVGRTGAGKSSLFNVLLRLQSYGGSVEIDGVDISKVGLTDLRSKITFILQEPTLSTGTLRHNLDPFEKFTDVELWDALQKVNLKRKVQKQPGRLDMEIEVGGSNFSGGQKQLLCMARALLNNNKIMLLDEITANVDKETDTLLHKMINEEFKECTILHISHRLETLIEYDNILVIDSGSVVEFDHPHVLLQDPEGQFSSMVKQLGHQQASLLKEIACESYHMQYKRRKRLSSTSESALSDPGVDIHYSEDDRHRAPVVRRLSEHLHKKVRENRTTELRVAKMAVLIENGKHPNGMVVHSVAAKPTQGSCSSSEQSSISDLPVSPVHTSCAADDITDLGIRLADLEDVNVQFVGPSPQPLFLAIGDSKLQTEVEPMSTSEGRTLRDEDSEQGSDNSDFKSTGEEPPADSPYKGSIELDRASSKRARTISESSELDYSQHNSMRCLPKVSSANIESGRRAVKRAKLLSASLERNATDTDSDDSTTIELTSRLGLKFNGYDVRRLNGRLDVDAAREDLETHVSCKDNTESTMEHHDQLNLSASEANGNSYKLNGNLPGTGRGNDTFTIEHVTVSDSEDAAIDSYDSVTVIHPRIAFPSKTKRTGSFGAYGDRQNHGKRRSPRVRFQEPVSNGRDNPSFVLGE